MNANKIKKQELRDILQKYIKNKVPNFTAEEINRKALSGFLHTTEWCALDPCVSQAIEPDNYLKFQAPALTNNSPN